MTAEDKAEKLMAWRDRKVDAGFYLIHCRATGEKWIGRAPNLATIWNRQSFTLRMNSHPHPRLQAAWREQGGDAFGFEVLERLDEKESRLLRGPGVSKRLAAWCDKAGAKLL